MDSRGVGVGTGWRRSHCEKCSDTQEEVKTLEEKAQNHGEQLFLFFSLGLRGICIQGLGPSTWSLFLGVTSDDEDIICLLYPFEDWVAIQLSQGSRGRQSV